MKHCLHILVLLLMFCLILTGCGGPAAPSGSDADAVSGGSDGTTSDTGAESSEPDTSASSEVSSVTVTSSADNITSHNSSSNASVSSAANVTSKTTTSTAATSKPVESSSNVTTSTPTAPGEEPTEIGIWYSTWYAYSIPGSSSNTLDTWAAWDLDFKPLMPDGTFNYYDSMNKEVMQFHLEKMSEAQIDFIIMDQTNNIDVDGGYINARSLAMAKYIKQYNDSGARPVRYCSAIGGIQWSHDGATIELEAGKLWSRYVSQDFGGEKYHEYYQGKPLLIVYGDGGEDLWKSYLAAGKSQTNASKFTIRWADNQSRPGYWGWAYDKGPQWNGETTLVMPGWHNRVGHTPVNRNYGETYKNFWRKVLSAKERPRFIVINSFNEYAERTAVFPAQARPETREGDKWYVDESKKEDPFMYWNMTVEYIKQFKAMNKPLYQAESVID